MISNKLLFNGKKQHPLPDNDNRPEEEEEEEEIIPLKKLTKVYWQLMGVVNNGFKKNKKKKNS